MKTKCLLLWSVIALCACGTDTPAAFGPANAVPLLSSCEAKDGLTVMSASKDGQRLSVIVQHSGGCETHGYAACVLPQAETRLRVIHDAKGDGCEALLTETLTIDLGPDLEFDEAIVDSTDTLILR